MKKGKSNPNYRHGKCASPEHYAHGGMIARCYRPKTHNYRRYGGRGIKVCEQWLGENGFKTFLKDMGERPSPNHSLGRINNDGNYEPSNCRWETVDEQRSNRSDNRLLSYNGKNLPAFKWAEIINVPGNIIRTRIDKLGWSVEKALTTPLQKNRKRTKDGKFI